MSGMLSKSMSGPSAAQFEVRWPDVEHPTDSSLLTRGSVNASNLQHQPSQGCRLLKMVDVVFGYPPVSTSHRRSLSLPTFRQSFQVKDSDYQETDGEVDDQSVL